MYCITWNDVQCSNKCGKACCAQYMIVHVTSHTETIFWLAQMMWCIMTSHTFPPIVGPIISNALKDRWWVQQGTTSWYVCVTEVLQEKAISGGALELLDKYLTQYQTDDGLCNMILVTIASITDSGKWPYTFRNLYGQLKSFLSGQTYSIRTTIL